MREINLIVVHCSATRRDQDYTPQALTRDHRARGFTAAGYNYYIRKTGEVISMRPLELVPAHAKGYNVNSIGICYEGGLESDGKPADTRTPAQKNALIRLIKKLKAEFPIRRVCGHRDLSPDRNRDGRITSDEWIKMCPCFDAENEYKNL